MKWFYEIPNSESVYFLMLCQDLILKVFILIFICWWCVNLSSAFKWESNWPPLGRVRGISCFLKKVASAGFLYAGSSLSDLLTEAKHQFSWQLYSILGNSGRALACRDSESILALTPNFIVKHIHVDIISVSWTITCIKEFTPLHSVFLSLPVRRNLHTQCFYFAFNVV